MKIDAIGDIHGCYNELCELLTLLGYEKQHHSFIHPVGRTPLFLGDLTDRGPNSLAVIQLVYHMVIVDKKALYVPGNHCNKLYRFFLGNNVKLKHGLETTAAELNALNKEEQQKIKQQFISLYEQSPIYIEIEPLHAVAAHAGIKEEYIGRYDQKVKTFVLYGDITGETDEYGRPVRLDWAQHYNGNRWIIYGHTPVLKPRKVNKTINIDTGCVFGNALTAFSLPEEKVTSVPSQQPFIEDRFR